MIDRRIVEFFPLLLSIMFIGAAEAGESVDVIQTTGSADYSVVSNYFLISTSKNYKANIPTQVSVGSRIPVRYLKGGELVDEAYSVSSISMRGDLCWIKRSEPDRYLPTLDNTITVKPCRKLR